MQAVLHTAGEQIELRCDLRPPKPFHDQGQIAWTSR